MRENLIELLRLRRPYAVAGIDDTDIRGLVNAIARPSAIAEGSAETLPLSDRILPACTRSVSLAENVDDDTKAWLQTERDRLGLVDDHLNALYLHVVVTHVDKPMDNAYRDIILRAEAEAALPTMLGQPVDVRYGWEYDWDRWEYKQVGFDGHERERHGGKNGICGFVYAVRLNGDAIECGIVVWAYEFPDMAEDLLRDIDYMGASFDVLGNSVAWDRESGSRTLKELTFCGFALLYQVKAADRDTSVGDPRYLGTELMQQVTEDVASGARVPLLLLKVGDKVGYVAGAVAAADTKGGPAMKDGQNTDGNTPVAATQAGQDAEEITRLTNENTRLSGEIDEYKTKLSDAEAARDTALTQLNEANTALEETKQTLATVEAERDTAIAERDEARQTLAERDEAEATAQRVADRMARMREFGDFESPEAETAMAEQVGGMSDDKFEAELQRHRGDVLERKGSTAGKGTTRPVGSLASANARQRTSAQDDPEALGLSLAQMMTETAE